MIGSALVDRVQISPNIEPRWHSLKPSLLVLHYTGMKSGPAAVDWLCNPQSKVSCHYLVDVDGAIIQMVDEGQRAWHAGVSTWHGQSDINSASIGIEIQNEGHGAGCPPFPAVQMRRVGDLCLDVMARHGLSPQDVVGHSDVAPGRKVDPGEAFDWCGLAARGVGRWVELPCENDASPCSHVEMAQRLLGVLGYGLDVTGTWDERSRIVLRAFQQRWRPRKVDGALDAHSFELLRRLVATLPDAQFSG